MDTRTLFADHIQTVCKHLDSALQEAAHAGVHLESIVFHAGSEQMYHGDDQSIPFRPDAHFARLAPVPGADHFVLYEPNTRLRLIRLAPNDFWHEPPNNIDHPYAEAMQVETVGSREEAIAAIGQLKAAAYVGSSPKVAADLGLATDAVEPSALMAPLNWARAFKTPYEAQCLRDASKLAAIGHAAVRRGVASRRTTLQLHNDYLVATELRENQTPYSNIIAWDATAATLHYQSKNMDAPSPGNVLLIDAGANAWGYASDITRTYCNEQAHPVFRQILDGMEVLQLKLVAQVAPYTEYIDIHAAAHRGIADLLCDLGVLRVPAKEAYDRGLTRPFLPHGVGHHLGLQVHDVGGRQINPQGEIRPPSKEHPLLRTTRPLEPGFIVTIEPGLYFIPMLLDQHRSADTSAAFNWPLVDELIPCGGVRIEDDILVTETGHENLSRPFVPGHRDPCS